MFKATQFAVIYYSSHRKLTQDSPWRPPHSHTTNSSSFPDISDHWLLRILTSRHDTHRVKHFLHHSSQPVTAQGEEAWCWRGAGWWDWQGLPKKEPGDSCRACKSHTLTLFHSKTISQGSQKAKSPRRSSRWLNSGA